jgi:hypothetical protein
MRGLNFDLPAFLSFYHPTALRSGLKIATPGCRPARKAAWRSRTRLATTGRPRPYKYARIHISKFINAHNRFP